MMNLHARMTATLDRQHQHPAGVLGRTVGARMVRQHAPETAWSIEQLGLTPTDHVLELGFGAGRALDLAARQVPHGRVVGLDVSPTMVRAAQRRNAKAIGMGRVALLRGDLAALPFATQQFNKIFSVHTLYFWPDPARILHDLLRVLKPNGVLVLTLSTGRITPTGERVFGPWQAMLEEDIVPTMRDIGFTAAELRHGPASRQFTSVAVIGRA